METRSRDGSRSRPTTPTSRDGSRSRPTTPTCITWDPDIEDKERPVYSSVQRNMRRVFWKPDKTTKQTPVKERITLAKMSGMKERQQKHPDEDYLKFNKLALIGLQIEKWYPEGENEQYKILTKVENDLAEINRENEDFMKFLQEAVETLLKAIVTEEVHGELLQKEREQIKEVQKSSYKKKNVSRNQRRQQR